MTRSARGYRISSQDPLAFGGRPGFYTEPRPPAGTAIIYGVAHPDVATVDITLTDGDLITVTAEDLSGHFVENFFFVSFPYPNDGTSTNVFEAVNTIAARDARGTHCAVTGRPTGPHPHPDPVDRHQKGTLNMHIQSHHIDHRATTSALGCRTGATTIIGRSSILVVSLVASLAACSDDGTTSPKADTSAGSAKCSSRTTTAATPWPRSTTGSSGRPVTCPRMRHRATASARRPRR